MVEKITESVILYFLTAVGEPLSEVKLIGFLYLTDLFRVKWGEKQLTKSKWVKLSGMPTSDEVEMTIKALLDQGKIERECLRWLVAKDSDSFSSISFGLRLMLENICVEWKDQDTYKLCHYIAHTAPMMAVEGKPYVKRVDLDLTLERKKLLEDLEENYFENEEVE
jgi:hypothetical protein